jgi:hypothetical protein
MEFTSSFIRTKFNIPRISGDLEERPGEDRVCGNTLEPVADKIPGATHY